MTSSYEQQLAIVQGLQRPSSDNDRQIDWCTSDAVIGLARTANGRIEVFLKGQQLEARFRRVRDALEYERWFRADGDQLLANRIVLPAAGHFEQVAAFLCTELLRNGAATDLPPAFAQTEPLIELAIEGLMIADQTLLGLSGEMLVLHALASAAPDERIGELIESWKGHRKTARDFQLNWLGVEVKTTTSQTSSHLFRGVHQLEVGHGVDGAEETSYLLVSLGLEWADADDQSNSTSLPELVDELIGRIAKALGSSATVLLDEFVARIASYGSPSALRYDRDAMADGDRVDREFRLHFARGYDMTDEGILHRRFRLRFARGYDMTDDAIRLLTTDDLRVRPFIEAGSFHLRVNLPDQVRGDVNPVVGLSNCAQLILTADTLSG